MRTLLSVLKLGWQPRAGAAERPFPRLRNFILDIMAEGRRKNTINLLFEADAGPLLRRRESGDAPSVTACIAHCFARTVGEDRTMQAYRRGSRHLVVFDDVDVCVMVEREWEGATLPVVTAVRAAQAKTAADIDRQLQAAKSAELGRDGPMRAEELAFFLLPRALRRLIWAFIRRDPYLFKNVVGTVGLTSMGMFARGAAVVLPITPMTLTLSIGGLERKPVLEDGRLVERDVIHLNLGADHDIIDGAPLMRFAERFKQNLAAI